MTSTRIPGGALALVVFAAACHRPAASDPRTQPPLVRTTTVTAAPGVSQSFTGVVTARVQSDLGFRVAGKIIRRAVDAGQSVTAGQPLFEIDVTDYTHAITRQAEAVASLQIRADQAAAEERRYRGLVSTGAVSALVYDQVKAAADSTLAQLASARAEERIARDQGRYALLLADADGTVVQTLAEPGQVVAAGQTVVQLAHAGPREAAVFLPETLRPRLGSPAQAVLFGHSQPSPATLRQLADAADPRTRTFEARYVLGGAAARAPLGATVTLRLALPGATPLARIPIGALTDRGQGPGVWLLPPGSTTLSFRPVHIARLGEEDAFIADPSLLGQPVVALGAHLFTEGQTVRPAPAPAGEKELAAR